MNQEDTKEVLHFTYTNHRGETAKRRVMPERIYFGTTPEHREPTWLMASFCFDRQAQRTFDLKKMIFTDHPAVAIVASGYSGDPDSRGSRILMELEADLPPIGMKLYAHG